MIATATGQARKAPHPACPPDADPPARRVLYHHRTQGLGVEGVHIFGVAKAFARHGAAVDIVGPAGFSSVRIDGIGSGEGRLRTTRRPVRAVLHWFAEATPEILFEFAELLYNFVTAFRLLLRVMRSPYDVVYERYSLFLFAGVLIARLRRLPIIVEVNDSVMVQRSRPLRLRHLAKLVERWTLRNATVVVTVSQNFKRHLMRHGLEDRRVLVIPNAIDPDMWKGLPKPGGTPANGEAKPPIVIGVAASFVDWHRPDFLVDCAADFMREENVRLLLVGDGPARALAEKVAEERGCADLVMFTGFVPHDQVIGLISRFDIAVTPNSNDHGSPMKIVEYMAAGKPIVAPAYSPIRELITHESTGLLFPPLDRQAFKDALLRLIHDERLRKRLGRSARRKVMRANTWPVNVRRILTHVQEILGDVATEAAARRERLLHPPCERTLHQWRERLLTSPTWTAPGDAWRGAPGAASVPARPGQGDAVEGRTILCFASGYDTPPTSKHHVMHLLAERNTVLWVNYHASRSPKASRSDLLYIVKKLLQVAGGVQRPRRNLRVLTPLLLPLPGSPWAKRLNRMLLILQVRSVLTRLRDGPVQVWSFTPDISYALGNFAEQKVVYYCVDDFAQFSGYDPKQVVRDEADLCRKADLIVTTSTALQKAKELLNPNTILVPHGVDYEHFSQAVAKPLPPPKDIADIPRPRLGFFGLIRDWVDLDLLAAVARRRKNWHFVLIGDSLIDLTAYAALPNMHFLGRKPYEQLPAYCQQFDVGLIPFKLNRLTRAVNPIKLREYLAAGLPVVSTPLPEVVACGHEVYTAEACDEFIEAIESALKQDSNSRSRGVVTASRARRAKSMARETWAVKSVGIATSLASLPRRDSRGPAAGPSSRPKRVLVSVAGGGFTIQAESLVRNRPPGVQLLLLVPREAIRRFEKLPAFKGCKILSMPAGSPQRRSDRLWNSIAALPVKTFSCARILRAERPDCVVAIGQRAGAFLLLAAKIVGVRTAFVECVTRVKHLSATGRMIACLGLADNLYVQWPQTRSLCGHAVYKGRLL